MRALAGFVRRQWLARPLAVSAACFLTGVLIVQRREIALGAWLACAAALAALYGLILRKSGRRWFLLAMAAAVMLGGDSVEIKAVVSADLLVLQPIRESVVTEVSAGPLDLKKLQEMPGIVGYVVQPEDTLWKIAKKFHTTVDQVREMNGLSEGGIKKGDRLILVKEIR